MTNCRTLFAYFMTLMVWSISVNGQAEQKAVLVDQFGGVSNGDMRGRFDVFLSELARSTNSMGIVYSHGTSGQIAGRTKYFWSQMLFRGFDPTRIEFRNGRNLGPVRSDFWLIPAGAAPPEIKPEAWIAAEFGRVYKSDAVKKISSFFTEIGKRPDHQGYVITYGTPAEIAMREKWITDGGPWRTYAHARFTLVNGGSRPVRTVMWLVPPGAENPKP